ncbi:MAG: MBL fold metallo-hydrolase [Terrimicrobiaceae bacterium]
MMEVTVLASGSSGNALFVRCEDAVVMIDAGLSARRIQTLLMECDVPVEKLTGILLTHEHGDHTRGLKALATKNRIPVFATPLTAESLRRSGVVAEWNLFSSGATFPLGGLDIHAFSVPHDAADPVGFVVRREGRGFAVLTDLGHATRQVIEAVRGVNGLLIETNHDETLLQQDVRRPWSVKQRILSRHGHLSNAAAAAIVEQVATESLRHIVLGHLSRDCNTPELALGAIGQKLALDSSVRVQCAPPDEGGSVIRFSIS